jgi:hypothetical protein
MKRKSGMMALSQWSTRRRPFVTGPLSGRHLREFIAALDHRVPHVERVGEVAIARAAAALRKKAVQRLAELEESD